jgi:serine/threonine protein kinase
VREIGQGSYGKVFLARQVLTNANVAIKCYEKDRIKTTKQKRQIQKEIEILKSCPHLNIIRLFEVFENETSFYIVTEYVEQGDLFNIVKNKGPLKEKDFEGIFVQLL